MQTAAAMSGSGCPKAGRMVPHLCHAAQSKQVRPLGSRDSKREQAHVGMSHAHSCD